jgi:hypothetical protein
MNVLNIINGIVLIIGLPTIIGIAVKLGKKLQILETIDASFDGIKTNVTTICTFLATTHKNDFPSNILKTMSPYQIQSDGLKEIEDSGLKAILDNPVNLKRIFDLILDQKPTTKLDVETNSFIAYNSASVDEAFKPIKSYLYNHPAARNYFPYLAAVYIRDKYLSEHPEIKQ